MRWHFQLLSTLLLLLTTRQTVLCQYLEEFWQEVANLAERNEAEAVSKFMKTGELPSKRVPVVRPVAEPVQAPTAQVRSAVPWYGLKPEALQQRFPPSPGLDAARKPIGGAQQQALSHQSVTGADGPGTSKPYTQELIRTPDTLKLEERMRILQLVSKRFSGNNQAGWDSIVHPYRGQQLTQDLIRESFGYKSSQLRQFDQDTYISFGRLSKDAPVASNEDGGMKLTKPKQHHMYVWKYFKPPPGRQGSIFQLVGAVETVTTTSTAAKGMPGYETGRTIQVLGPDSIYDRSILIKSDLGARYDKRKHT